MSKSKPAQSERKTAGQARAENKTRPASKSVQKKGRVLTPDELKKPSTKSTHVKKTAQSQPKGVSASTEASTAKTKAPAKGRGRPSKFTEGIAAEIVMRLSHGEPLRQICRDEHMPAWRTIYDWLLNDPEFSARIAQARELGEEAIAQDCLDIADNATNDWMESFGKDGAELYKLNGEHIQRSKLRIETRLKLLAKWNPRKWGEKVDLNHGVQPENPLASLIQRVAGSGLPIVKGDE